jgi:hypothetical protein
LRLFEWPTCRHRPESAVEFHNAPILAPTQPGKVANTSWSSDFQVAAPIDAAENTWYVFMRIPYASLI